MTTLKIEQYDFVSFCQDMYNAFKQGYEPVWTSDDSPQQIGFCFHAVLHKVEFEPVVVGKVAFEASIDTTKLQEQLKAGGEIEQMLADSLATSVVVDEKLHETSIDPEKDADKWDNKELGADEAYVETIEPPKEPTLDESLPKEEQAVQTKQPTKRGKKQ